MLDPIPVPPWLRDTVQPVANWAHLYTLPLHIHEVLAGYVIYNFIDAVVSPYVSALLLPNTYPQFLRRTQLHWNMHTTSFVNSILLSLAASYLLYADVDLLNATWEDRIWGYTGAGGMVQGLSAGFFLWDLQVCVANFNLLGMADLSHAIVALTISILGFRPYGLYYGIQYALLELSTPFVNIHWFLNKLGKAGSTLQMINGAVLVVVFGCCRLLWGSYLAFTFFRDVWTAQQALGASWTRYDYSPVQKPLVLEHQSQWWIAVVFLATHATVMSLSAFWFSKMIATIKRHFNTSHDKRE